MSRADELPELVRAAAVSLPDAGPAAAVRRAELVDAALVPLGGDRPVTEEPPLAGLRPESMHALQGLVRAAIERDDAGSTTFELDGSVLTIRVSPAPRRQGPPRALLVVQDGTMERAADLAVREALRRHRLIVELAQEGVWIIDDDGLTTFANAAMAGMLGYGPEEMIGRSLFDFMDARARLEAERNLERRRAGEITVHEFRLSRRDGSDCFTEMSTAPVPGPDGRFAGAVALVTDRTASKAQSNRLALVEDRYRTLVRQLPTIVYVAAVEDGRVELRYVSPQVVEQLGLEPEALLGDRWCAHLSSEDCASFCRHLVETLSAPDSRELEYRFRGPDGRWRWLRDRARRVGVGDEGLVQAVVTDVTAHREIAAQAGRYQRRLRELAAKMQLAEERERRRIAAGLHDGLSQTLAASRLELESVRQRVEDPDIQRHVERVARTVDRTLEELHDLTLDLSPPVLYERGLAEAVRWNASRLAAEAGFEVTVRAPTTPLGLDHDIEVPCFLAIRELLVNVARHADARTVLVVLELSGDRQRLIASVQDDGRGFASGGAPAPKARFGWGLFGLRDRIDLLGGVVEIDSAPGAGTRVRLEVPLRPPPDTDADDEARPDDAPA